MKKMLINRLKSNTTIKQTLSIASSNIVAMGIGFLLNMFIAKHIGVEQFGILSFAMAVPSFIAIFMEFGFYSTAAKDLADNNDKEYERTLLGTVFIVYILISLLFAGLIFVISYVIDDYFSDKIGYLLRPLALFSFVYTAPFFLEWTLKAINKIYLLSLFNISTKAVYAILVIFLFMADNMEPMSILIANVVSGTIAFIYICWNLNPKFKNVINGLTLLYEHNKLIGFPLYCGRIVDVGTANMDKMLIAYWVDAKAVGLYTLAITFASPINMLGRAFSISKFKDFAHENVISNKIIHSVHISTLGSFLLIVICGAITLVGYLNGEYIDSFFYMLLVSLGVIAQAEYAAYNSWLGVKGYTKSMRKATFKICIVNSIGNVLLTYLYGIIGTCIAFSVGYIYSYIVYKKLYNYYSKCYAVM